MDATYQDAASFLEQVFDATRLDLSARVSSSDQGQRLILDGPDSDLLLAQGGEFLDALQHLVNQCFLQQLPKGERLICDANNYRAARESELRAMANHAAEQVRSSRQPFTFGPMTANERRVIHVTLAEENDLATESIGDGLARRLRVSLRPAN